MEYNDFDKFEAQLERELEEKRRKAAMQQAGLPTEAPKAQPGVVYEEPELEINNEAWQSRNTKPKTPKDSASTIHIIYTVGGIAVFITIIQVVRAVMGLY